MKIKVYHAKRKNKVLKTITGISIILNLLSVMCIDGESYIPYIVIIVCTTWLTIFYTANKRQEDDSWQ